MPVSVIRYRLYQCGRYNYVEVWDTLEDPWERKSGLSYDALVLTKESADLEVLKQFREDVLRKYKVSATCDCTPPDIRKVINEK